MNCFKDLLDQSAAMHSHLCPRQVLGVRMGLAAGKHLGLSVPQSGKRLITFMETDGCAADGVSVATNCWIGRRTMRLIDFGKVAATFVETRNLNAIRISPHPQARQLALVYSPGIEDRWQAQLEGYQVMPDEALLTIESVQLSVSLEEIISQPGLRENCSECGEEIMNGREIQRQGRVVCHSCAGMGYYTATNTNSAQKTQHFRAAVETAYWND